MKLKANSSEIKETITKTVVEKTSETISLNSDNKENSLSLRKSVIDLKPTISKHSDVNTTNQKK